MDRQTPAPISTLDGFFAPSSAQKAHITPVQNNDIARYEANGVPDAEPPKLVMKPAWHYRNPKPSAKVHSVTKHAASKVSTKPKPVAKAKPKQVAKVKPVVKAKPSVVAKATPKSLPKPAVQTAAKPASNLISFPINGTIKQASGSHLQVLAKSGSAVKAAKPGTIVYTGPSISGSGKMVIVKHQDGVLSAYSHLGRVGVKEGQAVLKGTKLGAVSRQSGHQVIAFQVRKGGNAINPKTWLGL